MIKVKMFQVIQFADEVEEILRKIERDEDYFEYVMAVGEYSGAEEEKIWLSENGCIFGEAREQGLVGVGKVVKRDTFNVHEGMILEMIKKLLGLRNTIGPVFLDDKVRNAWKIEISVAELRTSNLGGGNFVLVFWKEMIEQAIEQATEQKRMRDFGTTHHQSAMRRKPIARSRWSGTRGFFD